MGEKVKIYKENFRKVNLSEEFYDARLRIKELYENSLKLHEYIEKKYMSSENMFTVKNILSGIEISKDGFITGWSEINWSKDVINNINNIVEKLVVIKSELKNQSCFSKKENVLMEFSNKIIEDFCNNQKNFKELNEKLKLCAVCDINNLDGLIFDLSKMSKKAAKDSLDIFAKYTYNINNLNL
ncbi:hypothetical protein FDA09_09820 [Clostridium botulinum]|uniref:hypothetical protein n=1 Tax=Clostridium botulinum TaxID=1491 RepID=UPI0007744A15|nr:hypothetical protein [Clostridium botulinum]NFE74892.1 hypothetical protein [Clostridium botulinum]NFG59983.1 hypothetical protein [Clostridium botulinum]NFH80425.1 hypothetical protein [Clostridium botulinum]NFH83610.1 hypothetical protein [Clostridium botulinum]NFI11683.1 hypothetical protein [Clostridium botulinum]